MLQTVLYIIGVAMLLMLIVGITMKDEKPMVIEDPADATPDPAKEFKKLQRERLTAIDKSAPSVMRSSILMWIVQALAMLVLLGGIVVLFYYGFIAENLPTLFPVSRPVFMVGVVVILLIVVFVNWLAHEVRKRNKYIIELKALISED